MAEEQYLIKSFEEYVNTYCSAEAIQQQRLAAERASRDGSDSEISTAASDKPSGVSPEQANSYADRGVEVLTGIRTGKTTEISPEDVACIMWALIRFAFNNEYAYGKGSFFLVFDKNKRTNEKYIKKFNKLISASNRNYMRPSSHIAEQVRNDMPGYRTGPLLIKGGKAILNAVPLKLTKRFLYALPDTNRVIKWRIKFQRREEKINKWKKLLNKKNNVSVLRGVDADLQANIPLPKLGPLGEFRTILQAPYTMNYTMEGGNNTALFVKLETHSYDRKRPKEARLHEEIWDKSEQDAGYEGKGDEDDRVPPGLKAFREKFLKRVKGYLYNKRLLGSEIGALVTDTGLEHHADWKQEREVSADASKQVVPQAGVVIESKKPVNVKEAYPKQPDDPVVAAVAALPPEQVSPAQEQEKLEHEHVPPPENHIKQLSLVLAELAELKRPSTTEEEGAVTVMSSESADNTTPPVETTVPKQLTVKEMAAKFSGDNKPPVPGDEFGLGRGSGKPTRH